MKEVTASQTVQDRPRWLEGQHIVLFTVLPFPTNLWSTFESTCFFGRGTRWGGGGVFKLNVGLETSMDSVHVRVHVLGPTDTSQSSLAGNSKRNFQPAK